MIKTPLSTVIGGAFWTPGATIIAATFGQRMKKLFANGEQGFWYDPSDMGTMFQDSAGTTAVNATGQPLGLVLDKSKGLQMGSELAPSNLLGWGAYGTPSNITTTSFEASSAGNGLRLTGLVVGKTYKVSARGSGNCTLVAENVGTIYSQTIKDCIFTATATSLVLRATTAGKVTVESFSLKSLAGNHAFQSTTAARPIFRQKPILGSELVVNGSFATDLAGWSNITNSFTWANGAAVSTGAQGDMTQDGLCAVGKTYLLSFTVRGSGGAGVYVSAAGNDIAHYKDGSFTVITTATSTLKSIRFRIFSGNAATIDNVSLKEVTGYRVDQPYIDYDGIDDKLITNLPAQLTGCTVVRSVPKVGTQILTGQTIPATYEDNKGHCGLIVINRALTPSETSAITAEFNKRAGV